MQNVANRPDLTYAERDIFDKPLSDTELRRLLKGRTARNLFSWRSPKVKELGTAPDKESGDETLIPLMLREPALIRRPLVTVDDAMVVGFDVGQLGKLLA
ncbi:MAG: hypothetical protein HY329_15175 [Chloroflexi bacterium]|nr:hypothetical protein [Chloroflexota bacterium]